MSTQSATARRRAPRRRPSVSERPPAARRRRTATVVALGVLAIVGVVLVMPLARRAVRELGLPLRYQDVIRQQAVTERLDPALIAAVIYAETKFDPRTSSAGAEGPMQILPQTAEYLARRSGATTFTIADLNTPRVNIAYGSYYLRYLLDLYHNSTVLALAAYNGGEANVDGWVAEVHRRGQRFRLADIRFPETRAYVERVLQARVDYRHAYPAQLGYR